MNMKKLLSLLLALAFVLSLCACGSGGNSAGTPSTPTPGSDTPSTVTSPAVTASGDPKKDEPEPSAPGYLTYDDLDETETFYLWLDEGELSFQIDYPGGFRFENYGSGLGSEDSFYFSIVEAHTEQPQYGASLEDAFYTLLNGEDGLHAILRMVKSAAYDEITPEIEFVTLDSGREAIFFSGFQHMDDYYGAIADCPIWGYCTMLDDIPVIVADRSIKQRYLFRARCICGAPVCRKVRS